MARWSQYCLGASLLLLMCMTVTARNFHHGHKRDSVRVSDLQNAGRGRDIICDACLQLSTEAEMLLKNPDTEKTLEQLVSQMTCENIGSPKLKSKCLDLVHVYVPDVLGALESFLQPALCTEVGVCKPERQLIRDTRGCALCQEFAFDALNYLESNRTKKQIIFALHVACSRLEDLSKQCDLLVDVYAPHLIAELDTLSPEQFCEATRLCKPAVAATQLKNRNDCAVCQFMVMEVKVKLRDPKTQERLLEVLNNGCDRVVNHVDECKMVVSQYAPFLLANLDTILDADVLCAKIGVCPPTKKSVVSEPYLVMPSAENVRHIHAL
ncbi:hypothetical protein R1sor_002646 [Riccia sorocarpa]|uniref:Saposin B-type domain-containing protein n=1 Tax=Riccia sorocarpa TaxID=122646 RepID=A0ABD3H3B8_9MARC